MLPAGHGRPQRGYLQLPQHLEARRDAKQLQVQGGRRELIPIQETGDDRDLAGAKSWDVEDAADQAQGKLVGQALPLAGLDGAWALG